MSAKPVRTRPTPGDPGSRLAANVEPLLTTPAPIPATVASPSASTPATEPEPSTTPALATAASVTPDATETPATAAEEEAGQPNEPTPTSKRSTPRKAATKAKDTPPADEPKSDRGPEVQFSTRVAQDVLEQARAVVMFTAPYGGPRSLAELVETALARENQRLADEFNDGEPYKAFTGKFRTGRPLGS